MRNTPQCAGLSHQPAMASQPSMASQPAGRDLAFPVGSGTCCRTGNMRNLLLCAAASIPAFYCPLGHQAFHSPPQNRILTTCRPCCALHQSQKNVLNIELRREGPRNPPRSYLEHCAHCNIVFGLMLFFGCDEGHMHASHRRPV